MDLSDLNPEQRAAVTHPGGPMRIIAGAGTGKTQTLTRRFAWLVGSGVRENRILALTYTNKAAGEMRQRITGILPGGHRRMWIQTFHSFCLSLIDEWDRQAGLPGPRVVTGSHLHGYALEAIERLPEDTLRVHHGSIGHERLARDLITFSNQVKDNLLRPEEVEAWAREKEPQPGRLSDLAVAWRAWQDDLRGKGLTDFAELGYRVIEQLDADPVLLERTRGRFDHVLVDEFQDTNHAQFELIRRLVPPDGNLCVVGDENQSIYAFRGGKPEYFAAFARHYPDARTFQLNTNYRSGQQVLDVANRLIGFNHDGASGSLTACPGAVEAEVKVEAAGNVALEGEQIAREIVALVRDPGQPRRYSDIAILFRSTAYQSEAVVRALTRRGIPCQTTGGLGVDADPLLDALAALRLIVESPRWRDAARLAVHTGSSAVALRGVESRLPSEIDRDALLAAGSPDLADFTADQVLAIEKVRSIAARARRVRDLTLPDLAYQALVLSGRLTTRLQPDAARLLKSFVDEASTLEVAGGDAQGLLAHLSAGFDELQFRPGGGGAGGVQISTVHSAKGLEWPVVFVAGLVEDQFPLPMKLDREFDFDALDDWRAGIRQAKTEEERESRFIMEERRLAYVAMTRAREKLYLTFPAMDDGGRSLKPSRFLAEAGLVVLPAGGSWAEADFPPASMSDVGRRLRTGAIRARDAATADPDVAQHLSALLLNQWAAVNGVEGAMPLRSRRFPAPFTGNSSLRLSFSQIDTYETCPRQFMYQRVLKLDDPEDEDSPALSFGSLVHKVIETILQNWRELGVPPSADFVRRTIDQVWPEKGFQFPAQNRQLRQRCEDILLRYLDWERQKSEPHVPVEIERVFALDWAQHTISGRIDAVFHTRSGDVEIVDFKTSRHSSSKLKPEESLQLFLYATAIRAIDPDAEPDVSFYALRQKDDQGFAIVPGWLDGQCRSIRHTPEKRQELIERIDASITGILENVFSPTPTYEGCTYCSYRMLCPEG